MHIGEVHINVGNFEMDIVKVIKDKVFFVEDFNHDIIGRIL